MFAASSRRLAGVARAVHAGRAAERVDLEAAVVGERGQPGRCARPRAPSCVALPANVSASSTTSGMSRPSRAAASSTDEHRRRRAAAGAARRACRGCASRTRAAARHSARPPCAARRASCGCRRARDRASRRAACDRTCRARRCPGPRSACRPRRRRRSCRRRPCESSTYGRSSTTSPPTMPTETAATGGRSARMSASLPVATSLLDRERERDPRAGDRRDARAAVGATARRSRRRSCARRGAARSTAARSERPIRRWISLPRPPGSRLVRVCVERGSIAYSAVSQPWSLPARNAGHAVLDARRAQHPGVAELDQRRAFGVLLVVRDDLERAELIGTSAIGAHGAQATSNWRNHARDGRTPNKRSTCTSSSQCSPRSGSR